MAPSEAEPLGITSVLTSSLPLALLTDSAPERYVVEAVFSRRVDPEEVALLLGPTAQSFLSERGYGAVQLTVSDRRLVIANTSLEELRDGLAGCIGELLVKISTQVRDLHDEQDQLRQQEAQRLNEHARAVSDLAESVRFDPKEPPAGAPQRSR